MQRGAVTVVRRTLLALAVLGALAACEGEGTPQGQSSAAGKTPGTDVAQPARKEPEPKSERTGRAAGTSAGDAAAEPGVTRAQIQQEIVKLLDSVYLPLIDTKIDEVKRGLQQMGSDWGSQTKVVGYGDAAHVWTNRETSCPKGQYVTGIKVRYRRTCLHQCDKDGGIIGNIELVCRSLK